MPLTLFEKIWQQHVVVDKGAEALIYIDRNLLHDGAFHADDVMACAALTFVHPHAKFLRTRDPEKLNACDVVVDVGGRPHLVYEANPPTMFVRDFNIVLVKEFCRAFSNALGANLHVQLVYGEEPHHVAEAIFKGLARALDVATQIEPRAADLLPSTKGKL